MKKCLPWKKMLQAGSAPDKFPAPYVIPKQKVSDVLLLPEGHNWSIFEDLFQVGVIQQDVTRKTSFKSCGYRMSQCF